MAVSSIVTEEVGRRLLNTNTQSVIFREASTQPKLGSGDKAEQSSMMAQGHEGSGGAAAGNSPVVAKDFYWDQVVIIIVTAILGLTVLDISVEFFRGSAVFCSTPSISFQEDFTRDQAAYINSYCYQWLPTTEYYAIFIIVHGLLIVAPHYLWASFFGGYFSFFFDLIRKLDRLRDPKTGEYDSRNLDIVHKLEIEFSSNGKGIFRLYIVKLIAQFLITVVSLVVNLTVFLDFSAVYQCPNNVDASCVVGQCSANESSLADSGPLDNCTINVDCGFPYGWPLAYAVTCVYTPLRLLGVLRYVDIGLVSLAGLVLTYGFIWCFLRHSAELGANKIALFSFTSCLAPQYYVFRSPWKHFPFNMKKFVKNFRGNFSPRVQSDLDFLILKLFRADSGHGQVFKDIQIYKEHKRLVARDHEVLMLFLDLQSEILINKEEEADDDESELIGNELSASNRHGALPNCCFPCKKYIDSDEDSSQSDGFQTSGIKKRVRKHGTRNKQTKISMESQPTSSRRQDLNEYFKVSGFCENPERLAYQNYQPDLGSTDWTEVASIRDRFYGFVQFAPDNDVAVDLSFGVIGFTLTLARAFREVISFNFHPFYRNEEEKCRTDKFYTNYVTMKFPSDLFSNTNLYINETDKSIHKIFSECLKRISFIVVGPIDDLAKSVRVNILIERFFSAKLIEEGAILLAVRPLKIQHKPFIGHFYKYKPSKSLFSHSFHKREVKVKLESAARTSKLLKRVKGSSGLRVNCAGTNCVFEFTAYKFTPPAGYDSGKAKAQKEKAELTKMLEKGDLPRPIRDLSDLPPPVASLPLAQAPTADFAMVPQQASIPHPSRKLNASPKPQTRRPQLEQQREISRIYGPDIEEQTVVSNEQVLDKNAASSRIDNTLGSSIGESSSGTGNSSSLI